MVVNGLFVEVPPLRGAVPLGGAHLRVGHLLGLIVLMHTMIMEALLCQYPLRPVVVVLILEAHLHVDLMLM